MTSKQSASDDVPSWMPAVYAGDESFHWRRAWVYELKTESVRVVSMAGANIWEAVWCGNDAIAAVVSPGPGEGLWYEARLCVVHIGTGESRNIYEPEEQIGWPAVSPSGRHLAIVEAVCSDRWLVAGELCLIDTASGAIRWIDTHGVDITSTEWCSDRQLLLAGHRGFDSVVALYDTGSGELKEVWSSREPTSGGFFITVSACGEPGDCLLVGEGFLHAPEIASIRGGTYRAIKSFDSAYHQELEVMEPPEPLCWRARDNVEIQGWVLRPKRPGPHPVVMNIHGGPVWHWRPMWLGRPRTLPILMLLKQGYGVFFPNPRGSSGRGTVFSRLVRGDMGGADTQDYLSGLDYLIEHGIADPRRLGVMGISYGGFMTSWLITQDSRFAAAVAVAPVTNQVTEHLLSNIPQFVSLFLADSYSNVGGKYFQRSPLLFAGKVTTPTLNICGALDRCTPPEEAIQFHNALRENGVPSVLVVYPEEGHGVRKYPAAIDYAARVTGWFQQHMRP